MATELTLVGTFVNPTSAHNHPTANTSNSKPPCNPGSVLPVTRVENMSGPGLCQMVSSRSCKSPRFLDSCKRVKYICYPEPATDLKPSSTSSRYQLTPSVHSSPFSIASATSARFVRVRLRTLSSGFDICPQKPVTVREKVEVTLSRVDAVEDLLFPNK
jgi:hypothetical protein